MSESQFEALARLAATVLGGTVATLTRVDGPFARVAGSGATWAPEDELALIQWATGPATSTGKPMAVDLRSLPVGVGSIAAAGIVSAWLAPINDGGVVVAILAVYSARSLTPEHPQERAIADIIKLVVPLLRASSRPYKRLADALGEILRGRLDWPVALEHGIRGLDVTAGMYWVVEGTAVLMLPSGAADRAVQICETAGAFISALRLGQPIVAHRVADEPRCAELADYWRAHGIASALIIPLRTSASVDSAIVFGSDEQRWWSADDVSFALAIAGWITARLEKHPEHALSSEQHLLLDCVEQAADGIAVTDMSGVVVYANERLARQLGAATAATIVGRTVADFLEPHDLDVQLPGYKRVQETGHDPVLDAPYTKVLRTLGGSTWTAELVAKLMSSRGVQYVAFAARDVTTSLHRLDATIKHVPFALAHVSLDGQFLRFNTHFESLVGRGPLELRSYHLAMDVQPPPDMRGLAFDEALGLRENVSFEIIRSHLATSSIPFEHEYELVRPDGIRIWVELSISLVNNGPRASWFVIVVARDVTARHRMDATLRRLAETLSGTGDDLFKETCAFLGTALGATCVVVGRMQGSAIVGEAVWREGTFIELEPYPLVGTPCEAAQRLGGQYYPERVQQQFPSFTLLATLGIESYLGVPLVSREGTTIGILAVLSRHPLDAALKPMELAQLCAARISNELDRSSIFDELQTREEQLRQITESAHETFWLANYADRTLVYVSPAYEQLTGRASARVYATAQTWDGDVHPDDREILETAIQVAGTAPLEVSVRIVRDDGGLRWVTLHASIIRDRLGQPYRLAGSFADVTDVRESRRALAERERELAEALASSERQVEALQERLGTSTDLPGMVGGSDAIRLAYRRLRQAAESDVTVLIAGESGTGKELAANALHALSARRGKPFVAINCAAIPEPLLESELFGHVKGAFTGATRDKTGLMMAAEGGTLFLDEIGDMSPVLQVKLLRALQERQIRRVGDDKPVPIDIRLVSASHRDLRALVQDGRMREDFYYRIKVFEITMPALRERREDIGVLARHFVRELGVAAGKPQLDLSPDALRALQTYQWPGNVRELRNAIEHALVTASGISVQLQNLPVEVQAATTTELAPPRGEPSAKPEQLRIEIEDALRRAQGNRTEAARILGIGRVTLWKRMRRLGMISEAEPDEN